MRSFIGNHLPLVALAVVLIVGCLFAFTGCKTAPQTTTASIAVQYATAKYIEKAGTANQQAVRASRVVLVLDEVDRLAAGDTVIVSALRAYVESKLPEDLSPADKVLARALIDAVAVELEARVGEGVIPPDKALAVRQVVAWVRAGAAPYLDAKPE